jgi:hypothetical protein
LTDATDRYRSVSIRRICLIRGSFCLNVQIEKDLVRADAANQLPGSIEKAGHSAPRDHHGRFQGID